jgi:nucleolar protein 56
MNSRIEALATQDSKSAVFVYTRPTAVMLFDENIKLLSKIEISNPEKALESLLKTEWIDEEKTAVKKLLSEGKSVVVLGSKNEKMDGVMFSSNVNKLSLASKHSESIEKLREIALKVAKKAVADSVSDDNLIMQSSSSIEDLTKTANTLVKRLREWYELHNPELSREIFDHEEFVETILKDPVPKKNGMGAELSKEHVDTMKSFAEAIKKVYENKTALTDYVEKLMKKHCPNLSAVAGPMIGAELLTKAGSLKRMAMMPSSTIQLLGAEQALFRHLKEKNQKSPKFGILHKHSLVAMAPRREQGKAARLVADKISIAVRVDFFKGEFSGDKMLKEIKDKMEKLK